MSSGHVFSFQGHPVYMHTVQYKMVPMTHIKGSTRSHQNGCEAMVDADSLERFLGLFDRAIYDLFPKPRGAKSALQVSFNGQKAPDKRAVLQLFLCSYFYVISMFCFAEYIFNHPAPSAIFRCLFVFWYLYLLRSNEVPHPPGGTRDRESRWAQLNLWKGM